ncbi:MAG: hypothetical protein Q4A44_01010 [Bacteroidales bacterium]|nr:hypothetical protein [Bacteroidales bacterium]
MNTLVFLTTIIHYLNTTTKYAILRNYEGLPEYNPSRDIDIAILQKDFLKIRMNLVKLIESTGWHIVTYLNSDRLVTFVCGIIHEDDSIETLQLDFFFHTSVFGLRLLDNETILADRQFNGTLYHVSPAYAFLDKYTYCRSVGAKYPPKYADVRHSVEQEPVVQTTIQKIFNTPSLDACDKLNRKEALLALLKTNFKRYGLGVLSSYLSFEYHHIKNYLCSNTGFSIGFTGPDGSGKTTIINLLIENFGSIFHTAHAYYHFRPQLFGNLGDMAQSIGVKKEVDRNYSQPHRGKKTGTFSSLLRLAYYTTDYILGYWFKVKSLTRITYLVIFDRYFTDIICDSRRSRINLSTKFLYTFGKLFIPSLDYNILLTAKTDTILARKQELDAQSIAEINRKIDYLKHKPNYYKIINDTTPQAAVAKILRIIFAKQHERNLRRLN